MTTAQKFNIELIRSAARELRYCGYDARANYSDVSITVNGISYAEYQKLQSHKRFENICLVAPNAK